MSLNSDPLAGLYEDEEQQGSPVPQNADPLAGLYEDGQPSETPESKEFKRIRELRKSRGYEEESPQPERPTSIWEAFAEPGTTGHADDSKNAFEAVPRAVQQVGRGTASGLTFGASENIPALETTGEPLETLGHTIGSIAPIQLISGAFGKIGAYLVSKSPYLVGPLTTAADIVGMTATGATVSGLEDVAKGELPDVDKMLDHGVEWGLLDAALKVLVKSGRTVKNLFGSPNKGAAYWDKVNSTITEARKSGIDIEDAESFAQYIERKMDRKGTTALATEAKAQTILNKEPEKATKPVNPPKPKPVAKETELAQKTLTPEKETQAAEDLQNRKVSPKRFDKIDQSAEELAEAYVPEQFSYDKEIKALEDNHLEGRVNQVAKRAETEQQFGQNIQKHIESQRKISKQDYEPFYKVAEEASELIMHNPQQTANALYEALKRVEGGGVKTTPEGYSKIRKTLLDAVEDLGYQVQRSSDGTVSELIQTKDVPVSRSMELGRRFNKIADFEHVDFEVGDILKGVNKTQKAEIRKSLGKDKFAQEAFDYAEEAYSNHARKFSNDNIKKIRRLDNAEKIAKQIESPTVLDDLKAVLTPNQYRHVERELLEKMRGLDEAKAAKFYREYKSKLTPENQKLAKDILTSKRPNAKATKTIPEEIRDTIFKDMAKAVETGQRPSKTLNLWKTERGQKVIEEVLESSPNKKQMVDYLKNQSLNDMVKEVVTNSGHVDFNRLNKMLQDKATLRNLELTVGKDGIEFLRQLEDLQKQLHKNLSVLDQLPMRAENLAKGGKQIRNVESGFGKEKIKAQAVKNKQPTKEVGIAKKALPFGGEIAKESKGAAPIFTPKKGEHHHGQSLIRRKAKKQYPLETRYNALMDKVPLIGKFLLSAVGAASFGFTPVAKITAAKLFIEHVMFNKKLQRAFKNAATPSTNPTLITERLIEFMNQFEEESVTKNVTANKKAK